MIRKILLSIIVCICWLLVSCNGVPVYTDVDSETELLGILSDSGKYAFTEDIDIQDVFDDALDSEEKSSENSTEEKKAADKDGITVGKTNTAMKYVLNTNTRKIHYPDCSSVSTIKEKNYDETSSREDAINAGYVPCKRCNP